MKRVVILLESLDGVKFSSNMGSLFHGWLMEQTDRQYAEKLHESVLKPYSLSFTPKGAGWALTINLLNDESVEGIGNVILKKAPASINLTGKNLTLRVADIVSNEETDYNSYVKRHYLSNEVRRQTTINFITPCSFKTNGQYAIFPDMFLIYKSLMNRFDAFSDSFAIKDESVLNDLASHSYIGEYRLRSNLFHLEGVVIPSFSGYISVKVRGNDTLASLANLILGYSEWAGIGIKTALGMGACRLGDQEK